MDKNLAEFENSSVGAEIKKLSLSFASV